jgi:integrase
MARRVRDKSLESREARSKLKIRQKPYYREIDRGLHLGYRKGKSARPWLLRRHIGGEAVYSFEPIGTADDFQDADGVKVLDFYQAQDRARKRAKIDTKSAGPFTVADAIALYVEDLSGDRPGTAYDVERRLHANVPPTLAGMKAADVTDKALKKWRDTLAKTPPRLRTRPGEKQHYRDIDLKDQEAARKRKVSANRCLSQLKRALFLARDEFSSNGSWRNAELFRGVESARISYLTIAEATRLVNVCDGDFRVLVQAGLQTGCRYGELAALRVADFNPDVGTLAVRMSKSGKPRHVVLTEEGQALFTELAASRPGSDLMLRRKWTKSQQVRPMKAACLKAKIDPPIGFHQLRHTWASLAVMAGMPLVVVARNLGHVDTRMVEKHYGHLAPSYVADEVRKSAPRFGFTSKVAALR